MSKEVLEKYMMLTEENKIKFNLFVAQLIEKQDNCQPSPDSQE